MLHGVFPKLVPFVPFGTLPCCFRPIKLLDIPIICRVNTWHVMRSLPSCYEYVAKLLLNINLCRTLPSCYVAKLLCVHCQAATLPSCYAYITKLL